MKLFNTEKFWNFIFTVSFLASVVVAGSYMYNHGYDITMYSLSDFLVTTLAAYRLTRLFVYDKVFDYLRDLIVENKSESGFFQSAKYFLTCPWCAGMWMSLFVVVLYVFVPFGKLFTYILAIAGVASFLHIIISLMGWVSEERKYYFRELKRQGKGKTNC